ncbi:MAG: glycosyltransferase family 2 protein [Bacteroidales bacterium]
MNRPFFTIVTVNLNNADGLNRTMKSVLDQDFEDFEYVIIDGRSVDHSLTVIEASKDHPKLAYWVSEPDRGLYHAMNKGIVKSKGEYLLFLNSGDVLRHSTILSQVFMDASEGEDILYGDLLLEYPDGSTKYEASLPENKLTLAGFNTNSRATVQHPAAFIRKSLFDECLYDENYRIIADIKFFIQQIIVHNCSVKHIPYAVSVFNLDGISSLSANWAKTIQEREHIFADLFSPRILVDYAIYFQLKDSELLDSVIFLEQTTGLKKMIIRGLNLILSIYKRLRRI